MERIKCTVSYDGTNFSGYQVQQGQRTVQGVIETALKKFHQEEIKVHASGRTDAFVHAKGQVFHFDSPMNIHEYGWKMALNTRLPADVVIVQVEKVSADFHARYWAKKKEYRYRILNRKDSDVFQRNYSYHYPYQLDFEKMNEAVSYFLGTHDFTLFSSAKSDKKDKVRTLYEIGIDRRGDEIEFSFVGNGFLYNMVRILTGALLEVGRGRIEPLEIKEVLKKQNRRLRIKTAPGHALYLWQVYYEGE